MSKGKTTVVFKGGRLDGHLDDDFDTRGLIDVIHSPTGMFYSVDKSSDTVQICKGKLSSNWIAYLVETYKKQLRVSNSGHFVYLFKKELLIERCTAFTLKGTRCSRESLSGKSYCNKTHKKWANSQLLDNPNDYTGIIKP